MRNSYTLTLSELRKAALFFLLMAMNEKQMIEGLRHFSFSLIKVLKTNKEILEEDQIFCLVQVWSKMRSKKDLVMPEQGQSELFNLPDWLSLKAWHEYRRKSWDDEALVLVLISVLDFKIPDVAKILKLSEGSVITRHHRGLENLLKFLDSNSQLEVVS